jgi:hypothetical protein
MMKHMIMTGLALAGCATGADDTQTVASAVNTDPGATTLSFHSPTGYSIEIRSIPSPDDAVFAISVDPGPGNQGPAESMAILYGTISVPYGAGEPERGSAGVAPLTAALFGLATLEDFTATTGFQFEPMKFEPFVAPPDRQIAVTVIQQAAAYALLKDGPAAGALASSFIANLGIDPCPAAGPGPKGF